MQLSDVMIALYDADYPDDGTIWETAFMYAIHKPVVFVTQGDVYKKPVNLMPAMSATDWITVDDLATYDFSLIMPHPYKGGIIQQMKQTILEKINQREAQILMGSYLYYAHDYNAVEDHVFDNWMVELAELRDKYPKEFSQSRYYEDFRNWEEGSGSSLDYAKPNIVKLAKVLYHITP